MGIDITGIFDAHSVRECPQLTLRRPQAQNVHEHRNAHLGGTNAYTTHSNGHRKAPKSENAYKLLLHKVFTLRKSWKRGFGDC
jgi:hypothetical protein